MEEKPAMANESLGPISSSDAITTTTASPTTTATTPKAIKHEKLAQTEATAPASGKDALPNKETPHNRSGSGGALDGDRKGSVHFDEKPARLIENDWEACELLGSVITQNCPGTRTSARVIQKMKQDQVRPITPPPVVEREHKAKDEKADKSKTSGSTANRSIRPIWTNLERNLFFDAVNEYGKDFDAIETFINTKLRRRNIVDVTFKTKDQVRQHYYTTFHKICKYVRFSDEIRKPTQELYALINYGEMRRKLQFVTDKHFMKLKSLVYHGHITVRCKGKNVRVKTPSCTALRKLNQLDDCLEDIRLPSKIEVTVRPDNMETFGRVQMIAQNPRVSCIVPLHKKLASFIKTFQHKWRSREHRLAEKEHKMFSGRGHTDVADTAAASTSLTTPTEKVSSSTAAYKDAEMCFKPKPGVPIHRPLVSITEYLSSGNICLTAYEERMGFEVRSETVAHEQRQAASGKRPRTESGSEKLSPEAKKLKQSGGASPPDKSKEPVVVKAELPEAPKTSTVAFELPPGCSSDELSIELNELLADTNPEPTKSADVVPPTPVVEVSTSTVDVNALPPPPAPLPPPAPTPSRGQKRVNNNAKKPPPVRTMPSFKPLLSEDMIKSIRRGWTVSNAADITIGDLYVVFGRNSRLDLHYYWTKPVPNATIESEVFLQKQSGMPYNPSDAVEQNKLLALTSSSLGNRLKHLLLIANLSERVRKRQCSCGHICDRQSRFESFVSNKTFNAHSGGDIESGVFRTPIAPVRRPMIQMDPVKQMAMLSSRQKTTRHLLVQRLIMPGGGPNRWVFDTLDEDNQEDNSKEKSNGPARFSSPWRPSARELEHRNATKQKPTNPNQPGPSSSASLNKAPATMTSASTQTPLTTIDLCTFANVLDAATAGSPKSCTSAAAVTAGNCVPKAASSNQQSGLNDVLVAPTTAAASTTTHHNRDTNAPQTPDSAFDESSNTSTAMPLHLLRESTSNSRWLEDNLNDFSLTSLLGHLDDINGSRDLLDQSSNLSVLSESSVDYINKFQEIAALLQSQEKD